MRTGAVIAMAVIAGLSKIPAHADLAKSMSERDALRIHSRWQRSLWSGKRKEDLGPAGLVALSTKRARARQTHPGKR